MPRSRRRVSRPARPQPPASRRPPGRAPLPTPSSRRAAFERRSRPALVLLSRQPRWVLAGALLALTVGGLYVRGPGGAAALLVVAALFGWLLGLSWPAISARGRMLRLVTIGALAAAAAFSLVR